MIDTEIFDIIFLRHGESVGNSESRWQGQADFPLTGRGENRHNPFQTSGIKKVDILIVLSLAR